MARKRRGRLGRLLKVVPACYAGTVVGGCEGPITEEHPLSEGLRRGKGLLMMVRSQPVGTSEWKPSFAAEVTAKQASARVLCRKHNGALSRVDAEALRLSRALRDVGTRGTSSIIRPPQTVRIDGHFFGRWLCKYYAGAMAMTGEEPHPDFVRYAFGEPTSALIYFLFPVAIGQTPRIGDARNLPIQTYRTWKGGPEAFRVTFEGLDVVVSTIRDSPEMQEIFEELPVPSGTGIIDRLRVLNFERDRFRIVLDWRGDPDDAKVLDANGVLTTSRN
jgi:hypothetical protein